VLDSSFSIWIQPSLAHDVLHASLATKMPNIIRLLTRIPEIAENETLKFHTSL
jgi:hypothetical protein